MVIFMNLEKWKDDLTANSISISGCPDCDGRGNRYDKERRVVSIDSCPTCLKERIADRMNQNAFKTRKGLILASEHIEHLFKIGKIDKRFYELSKQPPKRMMLQSPTGHGKSTLMKFWFNRLLEERGGIKAGLWFRTERELCQIFRDENRHVRFQDEMERNKPEFIFLDEFFEPGTWMDRYSDRHYANIKHAGLFDFLDWCNDSGVPVVIGTNTDIDNDKLPNGKKFFDCREVHEEKIVRRVKEMTGQEWKI